MRARVTSVFLRQAARALMPWARSDRKVSALDENEEGTAAGKMSNARPRCSPKQEASTEINKKIFLR